MSRQRLDKVLAHMGIGTRSELKKIVKQGRIQVNGHIVKDAGLQITPEVDHIEVDGERIPYKEFIYLMLNKPQGVISATEDGRDRTVLDLLDDSLRVFDLFPVGRLDKDTEGLLLLTNDGQLAHNLLSPRKHVPKTYLAHIEGVVGESDQICFSKGVELDDGYVTLPAQLLIKQVVEGSLPPISSIELTIHEGKFHQVKRMFQAVGKQVVYLKRIQMGTLILDPLLALGEYRELSEEELKELKGE
ncbi:MAG: pseudouridine synthase [Paenibacillaceae bacterium]